MPKFIARVELHAANYDNYEKLHQNMQLKGYLRRIKSDNGVTYQLPTGTYVSGPNAATLQDALKAAVDAANQTGKKSSVIVADWSSAVWDGLPQ